STDRRSACSIIASIVTRTSVAHAASTPKTHAIPASRRRRSPASERGSYDPDLAAVTGRAYVVTQLSEIISIRYDRGTRLGTRLMPTRSRAWRSPPPTGLQGGAVDRHRPRAGAAARRPRCAEPPREFAAARERRRSIPRTVAAGKLLHIVASIWEPR